jgi:hypothetical protein
MKYIVVFIFAFSMASSGVLAQGGKQKEVGLIFSSLNSYGITYKTGYSNRLWRFNSLFLSANEQKGPVTAVNVKRGEAGFSFGREFRRILVEDLELRYGVDAGYFYSYYKRWNDPASSSIVFQRSRTHGPSLNAVVGLNYVVKDQFVFGIEIRPGFAYSTVKSTARYVDLPDIEQETSLFAFQATSNLVLLTLGYRF